MRFTDDEKVIIYRLLKTNETEEKNCLRSIWSDFCPNTYIVMTSNPAAYIEKDKNGEWSSELLSKHLTSKILILIQVLDRLAEERLLIPFTSNDTMKTLGKTVQQTDENKITLSQDLLLQLKRWTSKEFGVSESLVALSEKGFVSDEEARLQADLDREKIKFRFSLLALFISLLVTLLSAIPAWVEVFAGGTAKVELTPESRVQVFEQSTEGKIK